MATSNQVRKVKTFGIGGITLISLLGGLLVVYPFATEADTLQAQVQEKVAENDVLKARIAGLQGTAERIPEIKSINDSLSVRFPSTADIPGLISSLNSTASAVGLSSSAFTEITTTVPTIIADDSSALPASGAESTAPQDNTDTAAAGDESAAVAGAPASGPGGNLASMNVSISIKGNNQQLSRFVQELSKEEGRAFLIKSFTITVDEENGATLTLETEAFLYRTVEDPNAPTPDAQAPAATPAEAAQVPAPEPAPATEPEITEPEAVTPEEDVSDEG